MPRGVGKGKQKDADKIEHEPGEQKETLGKNTSGPRSVWWESDEIKHFCHPNHFSFKQCSPCPPPPISKKGWKIIEWKCATSDEVLVISKRVAFFQPVLARATLRETDYVRLGFVIIQLLVGTGNKLFKSEL